MRLAWSSIASTGNANREWLITIFSPEWSNLVGQHLPCNRADVGRAVGEGRGRRSRRFGLNVKVHIGIDLAEVRDPELHEIFHRVRAHTADCAGELFALLVARKIRTGLRVESLVELGMLRRNGADG